MTVTDWASRRAPRIEGAARQSVRRQGRLARHGLSMSSAALAAVLGENAASASEPVAAATSTITINTLGSTTQNQNCANPLSRHFYALWIGLPMLSLVGMGAGFGKRSKKAWLVCGLVVVAAGFLLTPSCTNTNNIVCTPNGVTPANSYTFTIVGVDSKGVASSNTVSGSSSPTVTLTVTAPVP